MKRPLRWYDYISVNIYFLGLTAISQTMTPLVLPLLVQQFVGVESQGGAYGNLRLWSLMVALLVQSLSGLLSDHSTLRWGRRRPFIFMGSLLQVILILAIASSAALEGTFGYWFLFAMVILLSVASNIAHGAVQGLIPDIVPGSLRGKFSGVKAVLEVPLPVILVAFTIGPMISKGNLWGAIFVLIGTVLLTALLTMFAPEKPLLSSPGKLNWDPFLRLLSMTGLFTLVILFAGQIIKWFGMILENITSLPVALLIFGFAGILIISLTIAIGVLTSIRVSVGLSAAAGNRSFSWWVVNRLSYLVGSTNLASFAVFFLQGRLSLEKEQAAGPASQMILFVGLFILVTALPSGWLADHFGRKKLVAVSGMIAATGAGVMVVFPNLVMIYVGAILVGVATGLFFTANWALGTELVPPKEAGRYLGISNLAGAGAGAVGAYIGGPIADFFSVHFPESAGIGYVLLFVIYGFMFLLSILALTQVKLGVPSASENAMNSL